MSNIDINNSDSPQNFLISNNNFLSFGKFNDNEIPNYSIPVSNFDLKSNEQSENSFSTSKQLNSPKFSIPLDLNNENDNLLNKNSNCVKKDKIVPKKSFTTNKKNCFNSFKFNQNILKFNFLGKKKKILSSEEIELEKIKKEKEEIKKQKLINEKCYQRSKNYIPITITPSPLTILKPFHLSSSRSSKFLKNRMSSTDYEINKINNQIKEKIKKKCEEFQEKGNKNIYMNKSFDYGLFNTETKKTNNNFKTPFPSKILEKFYKNITIPLNEDNSYNILNNNKINNLSLSSRIKQYYNTTKKVLDTENKKKE